MFKPIRKKLYKTSERHKSYWKNGKKEGSLHKDVKCPYVDSWISYNSNKKYHQDFFP